MSKKFFRTLEVCLEKEVIKIDKHISSNNIRHLSKAIKHLVEYMGEEEVYGSIGIIFIMEGAGNIQKTEKITRLYDR